MFSSKGLAAVFGVAVALATINGEAKRIARSPDSTFQATVPENSANYNGSREEIGKQANDEQDYWQSESATYEDRRQEDYDRITDNDNQDRYEAERDFQEGQENEYAQEGNDRYETERDNTEDHEDANSEHYYQEDNTNMEEQTKDANDNINADSDEYADRYEEKGEDEIDRQHDRMDYDSEGKSPSVDYNVD